MREPLYFKTRDAFRGWLADNCQSSDGVWLVFGKTKAFVTVKPVRRWRKPCALDGSTAR